jgi:hypothetical protein
MNTSTFLTTLRSHAALPLVFRAGRTIVSPGYHLTEVKRVAYDTMDCGAQTHRWTETHFEVWVPPLADLAPDRGHMPAEKFLRIIDRVETAIPLDAESTARIHATFAGQPAALYDIDSIQAHAGRMWVELTPDRTRCKSAERRLASALGGCCGTGAEGATAAAACCA